jgi:RNA polymerase sigma factor (sigma-70 family)
MMRQPPEALQCQCLRRAKKYCEAKRVPGPDITPLASKVADLVHRNRDRARASSPPDPETGVPDEYVDDVIRYLLQEEALVNALKAGESQAWEELLDLLARRVTTNLRRHNVSEPHLQARADELIQHCAFLIWQALDRYRYDSSFEAWVSVFVATEVRSVCRSRRFRLSTHALSWETPPPAMPGAPALGERVGDEAEIRRLQQLELVLTIEAGFECLSPDQRELVQRQLSGQTTRDIAREMKRTPNAIYKIRQRAIEALQAFVAERRTP